MHVFKKIAIFFLALSLMVPAVALNAAVNGHSSWQEPNQEVKKEAEAGLEKKVDANTVKNIESTDNTTKQKAIDTIAKQIENDPELKKSYKVEKTTNKDGSTTTYLLYKKGNAWYVMASYSSAAKKSTQKIKKKSGKTTRNIKASKLKKKGKTVKVAYSSKTAKSCKFTKIPKSIKASFKKGVITLKVKKGTKKGTYKVKATITAKATAKYKKAKKKVTITIKVK
jgi:HSP20 family molecular chaperone IbpA